MTIERTVKYFTSNEAGKDKECALKIYGAVANPGSLTVQEIAKKTLLPVELILEKIKIFEEKKILEKTHDRADGLCGLRCAEVSGKGFLGISFDSAGCSMVVLDSMGEVSRKEKLAVPALKTLRGRVGEIKDIVKNVSNLSTFRGIPLRTAGLVISESMEGKEKKGISVAAEGLAKAFKCEVLVAKRATAAAYAEKRSNPSVKDKNMLYLHTDSGEGVVIEGEKITESRAPGRGNESYLRAWDQFDAVRIAGELVKKGVGTDIVRMVQGNAEDITIKHVLMAAEEGDELAKDLVRRAALALGVRAAYLANIFGVDVVTLGGGIEGTDGGFRDHMKESFSRFVLSGLAGKVEITGGISGDDVYSLGAALLCRREMFTEV